MATAKITLKRPKGGSIICMSNAAFYQRVTIVFPDHTMVFSGGGEEVVMKTDKGERLHIIKKSEDVEVKMTFEFSQNGPGGPFQPAKQLRLSRHGRGVKRMITVSSEDSTDADFNDTFVSISYISQDTNLPPENADDQKVGGGATA